MIFHLFPIHMLLGLFELAFLALLFCCEKQTTAR